jgi:general secretion pathway protein A
MYVSYFGLQQEPFSIAPDPRLLFMSERHREALAHLLYGVGGTQGAAGGAGGGFVLLTGEIGTGKTTVCRLFLEQVPAHCNVGYIFNPKLTVIELLQSIGEEFHLALPPSGPGATVKTYLDPLNAFLLSEHAAGRNTVLIIDEAQNLSAEVLEQLRLLTNLETSERKLLQIVLIGQPELRALLARPELEQLAQRVIARYHLEALTEPETTQYVQHRLEMAGLTQPLPFEQTALRRIHRLTGGVPRRINLLCDRALLGAFAGGRARIDRRIVDRAAAEVFGQQPRPAPAGWRSTALALGLGLVAGAGLLALATRPFTPADGRSARAPARLTAVPAAAKANGDRTGATGAAVGPSAVPMAAVPRNGASAPALLTDPDQAWRQLARTWGATAVYGDACAALRRQQLQCYRREMSLALIRQLGRPGIVTLDGLSTRPAYALLTSLGADSATLRAGDTEQIVTLPALATRWRGEFATLWRAPPGHTDRIADGEGGPDVDWLATQLAKLAGDVPPTGGQKLDAGLKARVRAFQRAQGLPADGQPGAMTFMQLNRAVGIAEPRLVNGP